MLHRMLGALMGIALGVAGCGIVPFLSPPRGLHAVVSVRCVEPPRSAQATAHRWVTGDVYRYDVALQRWNGSSYVDLTPPVVVVLAQKGTATSSQAVFSDLRQGHLYRVSVTARGNVGGTAATQALNTQNACQTTLDFTGAQDVENLLTRQLAVTLDSTPFSGTLTVSPQNAPANTSTYDLELRDNGTGQLRYSTNYSRTRTMVIYNCRTGINYRIYLTAKSSKGATLATGSSSVVYFNPAGQDVEQAVTVTVAF